MESYEIITPGMRFVPSIAHRTRSMSSLNMTPRIFLQRMDALCGLDQTRITGRTTLLFPWWMVKLRISGMDRATRSCMHCAEDIRGDAALIVSLS